MPEKIYWDSNVFLAFLQNEEGREAACRARLKSAELGEILIVTSALTIAEVIWLKGEPRLTEDKAETLNNFFQKSSIRSVNLDRKIAQDAQRLVWESKIRPKDSVHVATARHYGCSILETFDNDLILKASVLDGLDIRQPPDPPQGALDI